MTLCHASPVPSQMSKLILFLKAIISPLRPFRASRVSLGKLCFKIDWVSYSNLWLYFAIYKLNGRLFQSAVYGYSLSLNIAIARCWNGTRGWESGESRAWAVCRGNTLGWRARLLLWRVGVRQLQPPSSILSPALAVDSRNELLPPTQTSISIPFHNLLVIRLAS